MDPTIPELPVKDVNFRIYRDVRFSKDQTPYKVFSPLFYPPSHHPLASIFSARPPILPPFSPSLYFPSHTPPMPQPQTTN